MNNRILLSFIFCFIGPLFTGHVSHAQLVDGVAARYQMVLDRLDDLVEKYPDTSEIIELGTNDKDKTIYVLKVTDPKAEETSHQLVVGGHHGNEYGSVEVAMAFAESIAKKPLEGRTVYVLPALNITGYNTNTRREDFIDPNRDYLGPCGSHDTSTSKEPKDDDNKPFQLKSTKLLADFLVEKNISASLTLHTYGNVITYPWSVNYEQITNDHDTFVAMAELGSEKNNYKIGTAADLLYFVAGNFVDYAYWEHGVWAFLFEIGTSHYPSDKSVKEAISLNVPAMRDMLDVAPAERSVSHAYDLTCPKDEDILLNNILRERHPEWHSH